MSLISQSIKSLKGGISQQPDVLRFPDQGAVQLNGFSSEIEGLQKRPPAVHVARLYDSISSEPAFHLIHRDATERYLVMLESGKLLVWDLDGKNKTVAFPEGASYLTTINPREDLRMVTVADYTFIVNRGVTVKAATDRWATRPNEAFVWVKVGQYGKTYKITVTFTDGTSQLLSFSTPSGTDAAESPKVAADYIRDRFYYQAAGLVDPTTPTVAAGTTKLIPASTENGGLYLQPKSGYTISKIAIEDGYNGQSVIGFMSSVQRFNQLPPQCFNGYTVKVSGDPDGEADAYYLQYSETERLWNEVAKPGSLKGFDQSTLPHVLVREANGTFTFRSNDYGVRLSGDDDTNPFPSFLDSTINDVFFFRNRLGFTSGENVCLSIGGEFFKFFPASVVVLADTDPIDISVSHERVSILYNAVPFKEQLLLFSSEAQFTLRADGVLTPKTAKLDLSTEYDSIASVRPVTVGRSVFFPSERAVFSSINRFYTVQDTSDVQDAEDITSHVPNYIPNGVFKMSSSSLENILVLPSSGDSSKLWVYKFLFLQDQLVQQSWSHWEFEGFKVLAAEFVGSSLYVILSDSTGTYLEKLTFTPNTLDFSDEPYRLFMDRKARYQVTSGDTYDELTGFTSIYMGNVYGYAPAAGQNYYAVDTAGQVYPYLSTTEQIIKIPGDQRGKVLFFGQRFTFTYQFSQFLIKQADQQGTFSVDEGRLQLRYGWVNFKDSGPFTVTVKVGARKPTAYTQRPTLLGSSQTILGEFSTDSGKKRFPIQSQPTEAVISVSSSEVTPLALTGAGWEALYYRRNQAI